MAEIKQGTRIGSGAQKLQPGTEKRADQTLQAQIAQQTVNTSAVNTKNTTSSNNIFNTIKNYLNVLVQKVTLSNEATLRTEKILNALSKKIDTAFSKIDNNNNSQNALKTSDSTTKLLESLVRNFSKDDIKRIADSVDGINAKLINFKINQDNTNTNKETENAVLTYIKDNESTYKQFVDKFDTSVQELKQYTQAINNFVSQNTVKSGVTSTDDFTAVLTQFNLGIESINDKLSQSASGHLYTFADTSEKYKETIEGIVQTLKESNNSKISIDTKFYGSVEKFLNDISLKLNNQNKVPKINQDNTSKSEITGSSKPILISSTQTQLTNKVEEYVSKLAITIDTDLKNFKEALLANPIKEKETKVIYIPQHNQQNPKNVDTTTQKTTVINFVPSNTQNEKQNPSQKNDDINTQEQKQNENTKESTDSELKQLKDAQKPTITVVQPITSKVEPKPTLSVSQRPMLGQHETVSASNFTVKTVSPQHVIYQDTMASNEFMKGTKVPGKLNETQMR